jgi:hypothetical protein
VAQESNGRGRVTVGSDGKTLRVFPSFDYYSLDEIRAKKLGTRFSCGASARACARMSVPTVLPTGLYRRRAQEAICWCVVRVVRCLPHHSPPVLMHVLRPRVRRLGHDPISRPRHPFDLRSELGARVLLRHAPVRRLSLSLSRLFPSGWTSPGTGLTPTTLCTGTATS